MMAESKLGGEERVLTLVTTDSNAEGFFREVARTVLEEMGYTEDDALLMAMVPDETWTEEEEREVYESVEKSFGREARSVLEDMSRRGKPKKPNALRFALLVKNGTWLVVDVHRKENPSA